MFDLFGWRARREEEAKQARIQVEQELKEKRSAQPTELAQAITTSTAAHITGAKTVRQLGAVFTKWHENHHETLEASLYVPAVWDHACQQAFGDTLSLHQLVELSLRCRARELGANAVVGMRIRSFKNGCEGSGDAVLIEFPT